MSVDDGSVNMVHALINNILKLAESTKKSEDLFTIDVAYAVDTYIDEKYAEKLMTEEELKSAVEEGIVTEKEADRLIRPEKYDRYGNSQFRVICKTDAPEAVEIKSTIEHLKGIFNVEASFG
jgi:hypothetical protein